MMIWRKKSKVLIINKYVQYYKKILISEKEVKKAFVNIKYNLVDADGNMHIMVGSLIEINSIITGSNNISLRKVNVKPYRFNKMCMDKDLIYYKFIK